MSICTSRDYRGVRYRALLYFRRLSQRCSRQFWPSAHPRSIKQTPLEWRDIFQNIIQRRLRKFCNFLGGTCGAPSRMSPLETPSVVCALDYFLFFFFLYETRAIFMYYTRPVDSVALAGCSPRRANSEVDTYVCAPRRRHKNTTNFLPRCSVIGFAENRSRRGCLPRYFAVVAAPRTKVLRPCLLPLTSHVSARPRDSRDSLFTLP